MSGIMDKAARTSAIKELKRAARNVQLSTSYEKGEKESQSGCFSDLRAAWKAFPECRDDCNIPPVAEILEAIKGCELIALFEKRNSFTKKNRWLKGQKVFGDAKREREREREPGRERDEF